MPQLGARRHCGALSIAVSGAARGTRSNFIIGAERIRRCLIASCCAGNVIARRTSGAAIRPGGRRGGSKAKKSKTPVISICVRRTHKSGHSELGLFRCSNSGCFAFYRPVVASGSGDRADLVEYRRLLTRSSHLSSAVRAFAILKARKAISDLVPQTPSAGPARNPSSISRFCASMILPGGGFDLLVLCSGATTAVGSA